MLAEGQARDAVGQIRVRQGTTRIGVGVCLVSLCDRYEMERCVEQVQTRVAPTAEKMSYLTVFISLLVGDL